MIEDRDLSWYWQNKRAVDSEHLVGPECSVIVEIYVISVKPVITVKCIIGNMV